MTASAWVPGTAPVNTGDRDKGPMLEEAPRLVTGAGHQCPTRSG